MPTPPRERASASALALLGLLAAGCGPAEPVEEAPPAPPNLLLIISDDHGYGDFGFMGSPVARTPHIDQLAREGTVFPVAYNTASICQPSLITLLTGLYPEQWEATSRDFERRAPQGASQGFVTRARTLPRLLRRAGYRSFQGGKFWEGTYEMAGFTHGLKVRDRQGLAEVDIRSGGRASLALGRRTLMPLTDFIDAHTEEPFFVWYAPFLPHVPHDAPPEFEALYADDDLTAHERRYLANVTRLDDTVGKLVAHLEARELRDDTLIIFLADNGWQPSPPSAEREVIGGAKGKGTIYELGWRTPLVFNWPGRIPAGVVNPGLVSTVDLFPTLLDYAGVEVPADRPGHSLRPALEDGIVNLRKMLYGSDRGHRPRAARRPDSGPQHRSPTFFARSERWRYVWNSGKGKESLYDIVVDPEEERDVSAAHPELTERFRRDIEAWDASVQGSLLPDPF